MQRAMLRPAKIDRKRVMDLRRQMQTSFNENAYGATALFALESRNVASVEELQVDDYSPLDRPVIMGIQTRLSAKDQDEEESGSSIRSGASQDSVY
jgi:hypothetical protein